MSTPPTRRRLPVEGFMSKGRFEAFTDGVFAIAITLLVLEIHLPERAAFLNGTWLAQLTTPLLTYVLSFLTVGVIWMNHHSTYTSIKYVDRTMNLLNLVLLMTVCFVPFPTAMLAEYGSIPAAAAFYGLVFFLMGASYAALWWYASALQHRVDPSIPPLDTRRKILGSIGTVFYLLGTAISFVSPPVAIVIYVAVTLYYLMPGLFRRHPQELGDDVN